MTEFWKNKSVLVTGAGGFIGSHLVERLQAKGANVCAFVRYNSRGDSGLLQQLSPDVLKNINVVGGDIRDSTALLHSTKGIGIIFHLGALISIPYSYLHPREVAESNFLGTLNILMACQENQTVRLIHASSSEVYGSAQYTPMDEEHPLHGQSPYSASKIGADKLVESFYCTYNLPVVTVRPFNTFGPRQSARAVIPAIITQILAGKALRLGNLDSRRDFTYIDDTVDGFIKAGEATGVEGQTFNLGVGQEIPVGELANKIMKIIGRQVDIEKDMVRMRPDKSEVTRLLSDNSLAKRTLGWEPRISLEDGIARTVDWIRSHLHLYKVGNYEF